MREDVARQQRTDGVAYYTETVNSHACGTVCPWYCMSMVLYVHGTVCPLRDNHMNKNPRNK